MNGTHSLRLFFKMAMDQRQNVFNHLLDRMEKDAFSSNTLEMPQELCAVVGDLLLEHRVLLSRETVVDLQKMKRDAIQELLSILFESKKDAYDLPFGNQVRYMKDIRNAWSHCMSQLRDTDLHFVSLLNELIDNKEYSLCLQLLHGYLIQRYPLKNDEITSAKGEDEIAEELLVIALRLCDIFPNFLQNHDLSFRYRFLSLHLTLTHDYMTICACRCVTLSSSFIRYHVSHLIPL